MKKKKTKKGLGYSLLYAVTYLHALLPFSVLYFLSDILFFVVYYVVRYRRKLVRENLENALPNKSKQEIKVIEKKFYHHLCDYFVETVKILHLSEEKLRQRMKFENPELLNDTIDGGKSCILSLGHYANWEWVPHIGSYLKPDVKQGFIYKELHSAAFDNLFLKIRSRFRLNTLEMRTAYKRMIELKDNGDTAVIGFLTDQRPPRRFKDLYRATFLNRETSFQIGMERIAKRLGCAILYLDVRKIKRGYYLGRFSIITSDASLEPEFVVLERYISKLEETILNEPAYYLWSHNRWKF